MENFVIEKKHISDLDPDTITKTQQFIIDNKGIVFHEIQFNKIISDHFNTQLFYYFAYNNDGELIGVCPVQTIKNRITKVLFSNNSSFEIPYGGWVYDKDKYSFESFLNNMKIGLNEYLFYWSSFFHNNLIEKKPLHYKEFQTSLLNLSHDEDFLFSNYISGNTRHNIRRAIKKNLITKILKEDDFDLFLKLTNNLKNEVGIKSGNRIDEFYRNIYTYYRKNNYTSIFGAYLDDKPLSVMLCIGNKNCTHAWIAGRISNMPKNLYQNELMWWESIKWARNAGADYYDLCVVEQERLPNIAQFKLGFSKNLTQFYYTTKSSFICRIISKFEKYYN